jgi:hypothetical protein
MEVEGEAGEEENKIEKKAWNESKIVRQALGSEMGWNVDKS